MGLLSRFLPLGKGGTSGDRSKADRDASLLVDFLRDRAKPKALDPEFESLLEIPLRWEIAPKGTLERLPLTHAQREQYDFVAVCGGRPALYLLDSAPVWAPGIPYIPAFLLVAADEGFETLKPIGTFDSKPEKWVFAWRSEGAPE
jgi:hypothetical protein